MADRILFSFVEYERDNVESALDVIQIILGEETLSDFFNLFLLGWSDRFFRKTEVRALPCLHFDENKSFSVVGDDVDLTAEQPEVAGDDPVFFSLEIAECGLFT